MGFIKSCGYTSFYSVNITLCLCIGSKSLRYAEMRVLGNIKGVTLRDRIRSDDIGAECNVIDVARWVTTRETS
jgi:hypothetical protein